MEVNERVKEWQSSQRNVGPSQCWLPPQSNSVSVLDKVHRSRFQRLILITLEALTRFTEPIHETIKCLSISRSHSC